ncbi:MAG: hypothetical protein PHU14_09090 [Methylovulum sp.]|nr:hypothetical protein [Methylovulum sp.]
MNNQFEITPIMKVQKENIPEWRWKDIINLGLKVATILSDENNKNKYKDLYWLSKKNIKELITTFE